MSRKDRMGSRERDRRDYEETYGRGGGDRFDQDEHPHAYGTPDASDWRRAMRAYVRGHDRGWSADRKYREAAGESPEGPGSPEPAREEEPDRVEAPEVASRPPGEEATARTERGTRFGVAVPDRTSFTFHRSASTWRDRLPRAERLPRHTDRRLDGQRGEGDQA